MEIQQLCLFSISVSQHLPLFFQTMNFADVNTAVPQIGDIHPEIAIEMLDNCDDHDIVQELISELFDTVAEKLKHPPRTTLYRKPVYIFASVSDSATKIPVLVGINRKYLPLQISP